MHNRMEIGCLNIKTSSIALTKWREALFASKFICDHIMFYGHGQYFLLLVIFHLLHDFFEIRRATKKYLIAT